PDANTGGHLIGGQSTHSGFVVAPQEDVAGKERRRGGEEPAAISPALLGQGKKKGKLPTQEMPRQRFLRSGAGVQGPPPTYSLCRQRLGQQVLWPNKSLRR